ncbi:hypothetical protein CCP3SC1AL1_760005 [Gammaproteobacteria bacterium]
MNLHRTVIVWYVFTMLKNTAAVQQPKIAEADVLAQILAWLKSNGFRCWRNNVQGNITHTGNGCAVLVPSSRAGSPDIEGQLKDGRYFCIEVKSSLWRPPKEPQSLRNNKAWSHYVRQRTWIEDTNAYGGLGFFATSLGEVIVRLT